MKHLAPDYVYTPQGLQSNQIVSVSADGMISAISERTTEMEITDPLPGLALLPGFVNTHSHAFQRALRGHTHRALSAYDTFWTWRRAMYEEAERLNPDSMYQHSLQTYREMVSAGYSSVGEFHYVHHQAAGKPYEQANSMAEAVLRAGQDAGIRVVMLLTAYAQGDFFQPPNQTQRRFCDASLDTFLARAEELRTQGIPLGIAPHSVRAVPEDWLSALAEYARTYQLPLHIHVDEQMAEIKQCIQAKGCTPIELLERHGVPGPNAIMIHATHANQTEIELLAQRGAGVCVCPTTEGDLGDGIAPYAELLAANIPLSIGSDSNTRLDPLEELRWAEYSARMRYQSRRILIPDTLSAPGSLLLHYGTRNGANALGLHTGTIAPGLAADFIAIDLRSPQLDGWTTDDFLDVLFFGASSQVIAQTWVQGNKVFERLT